MKVYIEVSQWFKRYTGGSDKVEIDLKEGITAFEAVVSCGIPEDEIGFISIVNTENEAMVLKEEYYPKEGDTFKVYPQIIGG
jgi:hypothetical protein